MNKKIEALGDYILAKKIGEAEREIDGIIIPNSNQSLLTKAEVLSVGNGKKIKILELKAGDIIRYNEIESNQIAVDGTGEGAYFIRWDFIMGRENN